MIIEFPQAEKCCCFLELRIGVIVIIVLRLVALVLIILLGVDLITLGNSDKKREYHSIPEECYNLYNQRPVELVLLVVTVVLFILWLIVMIVAVIWESLGVILVGAILEIFIFIWFFFMFSYHVSMAIVREEPSWKLLWATILMVAEFYILWIMWSYYVDVKASYYGYRDSVNSSSIDENNQ
ncbi:uncharacterized protein LOC128985201 [Macrosteles quadrilineatus]|uniref:uncharacterized protein LOC128985201 n=1 Tax=Macrosteles quadrilineatus TaxID=74068 RepID=UPI0023E25BA7|nr:uncharacterized protein LOC128985201 [Macrosteles quadrilineatus]